MFKPLIQFVLQHLMHQNAWTAPLLQPFANQTICIDFKVAQATLTILDNGELAVAADSATADTTIHLPPSLAMRLLRKDPLATSLIKIDGNTGLATEVAKILATVRWDIEGDLSKVVGDIAAYQIVQLGQKKIETLRDRVHTLTEMLVEYWQEERPLIAKKIAIDHFNRAVDTLREDTDRLQLRLDKLLLAQQHSSESR
ncbi:ubiquinone biosynthesis accessory factor UbiJ [Methylophilus aquaticus]|uniref:Ubiquinone biosynthesis accessory factor UbiJ n=1 Tax=Methylophilus aquaticus TaxID=1971610 RepID=A0ABT9JWC5_9PROT|nr:SCP2 sterol-binding domain-containing protein [Methylophilus aquaticus]MDP8568779.1 SCP2 sterol-binding domain-containing protein [Methylophilus aquaticus]